uniref:uncharacterized protein LOC120332073 n=1 Tax=Styela clava TaxID=7725 RepID=UPI00193A18DA|nr:uncharacterized protein LOC120332073 [Styela clava]
MMSYQKVIAKINENTQKSTEFYDFAEPLKVFEKKLNVDVTPLLEEIDFYEGGRIIEYDYVPESSEFQEDSEEEREKTPEYDYESESSEFQDDSEEESGRTSKYDYVPESSEFQKNLEGGRKRGIRKKTHLDELFNNFKQGHICFVGPAGSGKSTLMKATSRDSMHGKYFQGTIKMVQYIQCKQYMKNSKVTAGELIFNNLPKEERGLAIDYAKTHPEEVLFMLDSLDTLQYTIDGVYEIISPDEPAYPEVIIWNFLAGKLFPGCRILSSSREHSIRNYWGEVRPDKVIALAGLTMESIKEIISGYEGNEEAEKIMEFLKIKAPLHLLLCTTPVMLVYTLIALKFKSDFKPNTMTGIMTVVMQRILRSPHTHQENILEALDKLKELSYNGTVERRVLFTEDDFHRVNLKPEEATDLAILAPGGIYRKLFQGIHLLYFQHQSIQEMLTSFYILGLDLKSFDQFVDKHLHTGHFVLIRKMMCGLLLNPTVYEEAGDLLGEIKNLEEKQDILEKSLQLQLEEVSDKSDILELFAALNEAKDGMSDIVKSSLGNIDMSHYPLSISDVHVIGSVASYCTSLSMIFQDCDLKSASLQTLASELKGSNVKIRELWLAENTNMGVEGLTSVGQILSNQSSVEDLYLNNCNLLSDQLQAFKLSFGNNTEIKNMWLKANTKMGVEGLSSVGQILSNQSCVDSLDLERCNLSSNQLQAFKLSLGNNTEIKQLSLYGNANMGVDGLSSVGQILSNQSCVEKLSFGVCYLSPDQLRAFKLSLGNNTEIKQLSLYGNANMGVDGLSSVGQILSNQSCVKKLKFGLCYLSPDQLRAFKLSLGNNTEIEDLDLNEERIANHDDIVSFANLLPNVTEKLWLFGWNIADEDEKILQNQLDEIGSEKLEILLRGMTLISQRKPADKATNVTLKQNPTLSSESEFGTTSRLSNSESTEENVEISKEAKSPRSELLMTEKEAEQSDKEVTEQAAKLTQPSETSSRTTDGKRGRTSDGDSGPRSQIPTTEVEEIQQEDELSLYGLLKSDIQDAKDTYDLVEVLYNHRDDKKEVICEAIKDISIKHYNLNDVNIQVFCTIISKLDKLEMLNMQNCGTSEYLNHFFKKLEMTNCEIAKISIWGMKNLKIYSQSLLKLLAKSETESLTIQAVELENKDVDQLLGDIKSLNLEYSLHVLALSHNSELGLEGFQKLSEILHILPVKSINLFDCDLTDNKLSNLFGSLQHKQISTLDVSGNTKITHEGFTIIGQMCENSELMNLHVRCCAVIKKKLESLQSSCTSNTKISKLDVSYNETLGSEGMAELGNAVVNFGVKNLNIAGCTLNKKLMKAFRVSIGKKRNMVEELNMSRNPMLEDGITEVASLLQRSCLKKVDLSNCMLSVENIREFSSTLRKKNIQVETLNISENDPSIIVTRHHAEAVCELLKNVLKELIFKVQYMKPEVIKILQQGLEELPNAQKTMVVLGNGDILQPQNRQD